MLPSFHDDHLVGYEVECEVRQIRLHIRAVASETEPAGVRTVVFTGVEGYHFENDAFGNIILDLEAVTLTQFVSQGPSELAASYRMSGAPGTWASDIDTAARPLRTGHSSIRALVVLRAVGLGARKRSFGDTRKRRQIVRRICDPRYALRVTRVLTPIASRISWSRAIATVW